MEKMKLKYYNRATLAFLTLTFLVSSCRSVGSDNPENITDPPVSTGNVSVVVNLLGSEFVESDDNNPKASTGKQLRNPQAVETYYTLTSPSTLLSAEVSEDTSVPLNASAGINPVAAPVPGGSLANGAKFRLIAYKIDDGGYAGSKDFVVGTTSTSGGLKLAANKAYNMVVYSYGTSSLPNFDSFSEGLNFVSAIHKYNSTTDGFLYWKKQTAFTPDIGDNTLDNVILRHRIAGVTIKINSSTISNTSYIDKIESAKLKNHNKTTTFNMRYGNVVGSRGNPQEVQVNFNPNLQNSATEWISDQLFVNADSEGNKTISFQGDVTIGTETKTIKAENAFKIQPGYRTIYKINLKKVICGAKIGGNFREFACYNQGATKNGKPFIPDKEIHGSKYQWNGTELIQSLDWGGNLLLTETPFKTSVPSTAAAMKLPCDEGYRVPTSAEWRSLINENTLQGIGTPNNNSIYVFDVGMQILEKGVDNPKVTLMLPHAGYRTIEDYTAVGGGTVKHSQINKRGTSGSYWSSSSDNNYTNINGLYLNYALNGSPPSYGNISTNLKSNNGINLRCIKDY